MLSVPRSRRSLDADAQAVQRRLTLLGGHAAPDVDDREAPGAESEDVFDLDDGDAFGSDVDAASLAREASSDHRGEHAAVSGWGRRGGHRIRLDPGRPGAVVLCLVALLSAGLAAGVAWASRPSLEPVAPAPVVTAASTSGAPVAAAQLVVAVVGQVVTPGLVTLPVGSRVADAVAAAGGALPHADLSTINLARILVDGEQVAVGVPGAAPAPGAPAGGGGSAAVNINAASESELEELPGVGPVLAGRIVQWRTENGAFTSVEQLQEVDGIGPSTFEELRDEVTV